MKYDYPSNIKSVKLDGNSYKDYQNVWRISYDTKVWKLYSDWSKVTSLGNTYQIEIDANISRTIYVSYCAVQNCSDPLMVLNDLKENVFSNNEYYNVYLDTNLWGYYGDPVLDGAK